MSDPQNDLPLKKIFVVSSAHIKMKDCALLDVPQEHTYNFSIIGFSHGWFIEVPADVPFLKLTQENMKLIGFSPEFIQLIGLAHTADCLYLVIDQRAGIIPGLSVFPR